MTVSGGFSAENDEIEALNKEVGALQANFEVKRVKIEVLMA